MTEYITGWSKWMDSHSPMHYDWESRQREAEDEGRISIEGSNRGVTYTYKVYELNCGQGEGEWTGEYVEERWAMGKAPDRQLYDFGRRELRRTYTAPSVSFKGSGFYSNGG